MKAMTINSGVLAGLGGGGSFVVGSPNTGSSATPGPAAGDASLEPAEPIGTVSSSGGTTLAPASGTTELDPQYGSFKGTLAGGPTVSAPEPAAMPKD